MPEPPALKAAADVRREVEEASRTLENKQNQLLALMRGTRSDTGERVVLPHQADAIKSLEAECVTLTDKVNALKLDFIQIKTEEDLNRRSAEYRPAMQFSGQSVTAPDGAPGPAIEAAKGIQNLPSTLGEAFIQSEGYRRWTHGSQGQLAHTEVPAPNVKVYALKAAQEEAMKATLGSAGLTSIEKFPTVIQLGQQQLTVADLFANGQTNNTTIRYLQEVTFTNTAATVAEAGQKPEATWNLAEVDSLVKKIAWLARTTSEMFEDYPAVRDYINSRLPFGVRQREEFQLLSGDGTGANLLGVLNVSGILTQAKGADTNVDALYKAITKVRTQGFWEPDAIVIDPTNWTPIRLLKSTIGDYVWGPPSMPGPETIFGKRVVITVNMGLSAANTAIVGAWNLGGTVFYRHGVRVEATNSDASDFQFNRIAIRAEQREALAVWRPKAFCTVTGMDV
jgi:HK97 family phage major capsid protein